VWIWEIAGRFYCVLDEAGKIILEQKVPTTLGQCSIAVPRRKFI